MLCPQYRGKCHDTDETMIRDDIYKRGDMSETNITIRGETCNMIRRYHISKENETC